MNVFIKGSFERDVESISDVALLMKLKEKIIQIEAAHASSQIVGLKLLRGYSTHYRIKVLSGTSSFRIGAVVRGNTIWLIRFLSRKKIYRNFP
jgi:mRNA interferase RelE/StbE